MEIISVAHAAGVIEEAPRLVDVGANVIYFLLRIFGVLVIIASVIAGMMYLTSSGDERKIEVAKRAATWIVVGIFVALGAIIVTRQIISFLS
ncbi:MAG: hypothetical protein OEV93_00500 [Candidatus Moranbacteria bacterium]|nr:hypothetical protein [Candidatus Moranbacteria bacterium]